jgi:hypothetical protein
MARSKFTNVVREGFGAGLGLMAAFIVYILFGMLFFIPGFVLFQQEKKKQDGQKNSTLQITGIILMIIGVIIMGGIGFGTVFEDVKDMI